MVSDWIRPILCVDITLEPDEFLENILTHFKGVYYSQKSFNNTEVRFQIFGKLNIRNNDFLHFVTHDSDHFERGKSIDIPRCLRIHWIEDILKNHNDTELIIYSKFINDENRVHILLDKERYLLILGFNESKNMFIVRSAFYIDSDRKLSSCWRDYRLYKKSV